MKTIHRRLIAGFVGLIVLLLLIVFFKLLFDLRVEQALDQRTAEQSASSEKGGQEQGLAEVQENKQADGQNHESEVSTREVGAGTEQEDGQPDPVSDGKQQGEVTSKDKGDEPNLEKEGHDDPEPVDQSKEDAQEAQIRISQTYLAQLKVLQISCESKGSQLVAEIATEMKQSKADGTEVSMEQLQGTFLPALLEAEAQCDQEFQTLMADAEKEFLVAGIDADELNVWQLSYIKAKNQARDKAIDQLAGL